MSNISELKIKIDPSEVKGLVNLLDALELWAEEMEASDNIETLAEGMLFQRYKELKEAQCD